MFSYGYNLKNDPKQSISSPNKQLYKLKTKQYPHSNMNKSSGFIKKHNQTNQQQKSMANCKFNHQEQFRYYDKKHTKYPEYPHQKYNHYEPNPMLQKQFPQTPPQSFNYKKNDSNYQMKHDWKMKTSFHVPHEHKQQNQRAIFKDVYNNNLRREQVIKNIPKTITHEIKRDHIRQKDLQYRMNNIENINDKINDLLNLVNKKGDIDQRPKSYLKNQPRNDNRYQKINTSPFNKKYPHSHAPEVKQFDFRQIDTSKQKQQKTQKQHGNKMINHQRSLERLRNLSSVQPVFHKNDRTQSKYIQNLTKTKQEEYCNKDDEWKRQRSKTNYNLINEKNKEQIKYVYNYYRPNTNQHLKDGMEKLYQVSPKAKPSTNIDKYLNQTKPSPSNLNNSSHHSYLPISHRQPFQRGQSTSEAVDNQIRQIRSRTKELQGNNNRYYEVLAEEKQRSYYKRKESGQKSQKSKNKTFQIKLLPVINDKQQTIKIAQRLFTQIQKDSLLKKVRMQLFNANASDEQMWKDLQSSINSNGIKLTSFQIKSLLMMPQYEKKAATSSDIEHNKREIVDLLCSAQRHWEGEVCACATIRLLKNQNFSASHLDCKKKGYLDIQDLCDFVHEYTGRTVQKGDMHMIYKRLQYLQGKRSAVGIQYNTFIRAFAM